MHLGGLALGLLVAAPQLTGSLLRIPFGGWVDRVGGRLPMLTLFALSLVGMWGLVFILLTAKTLTVAAYPIVIMFGFLSGCGVASFSVGVPQVSYWYPQSRQGTVLGAYGGIGNLAPGLFTLLLPYAIAMLGTGRLLFCLVHVPSGRRRHLCLVRPRRLFLPVTPARLQFAGQPKDRGRKGRAAVSERARMAGRHHGGGRAAHLGPRRALLRLLRWLSRADGLVSDLLDQSASYGREVRRDARRARLFAARSRRSGVRWHDLGTLRRRADRGSRLYCRVGRRADPHFRRGLLAGSRRRIADRARHGRRQRRGIQDGAEICARGGRRRGGNRRRIGCARRLHHSAVSRRRRRCARDARLCRRLLRLRRARGDGGLRFCVFLASRSRRQINAKVGPAILQAR